MEKCPKAVRKTRVDLQELLEKTIGSKNVYFQPPESTKMKYPCIRYELSNLNYLYADDISYNVRRNYEIMLIVRDPDSCLIDKVANLPQIHFDRFYTSDNLNHYVFTIYY